MTHIGFTGTQDGMTKRQSEVVQRWIRQTEARWLHHGDCLGADAQAHLIALSLRRLVSLHPPADARKRAFCQDATEIHAERAYMVRNRAIVDAADLVIAAPKEMTAQRRSGTWATIRYALQRHKPLVIVYPNGTWHTENVDPVLANKVS